MAGRRQVVAAPARCKFKPGGGPSPIDRSADQALARFASLSTNTFNSLSMPTGDSLTKPV